MICGGALNKYTVGKSEVPGFGFRVSGIKNRPIDTFLSIFTECYKKYTPEARKEKIGKTTTQAGYKNSTERTAPGTRHLKSSFGLLIALFSWETNFHGQKGGFHHGIQGSFVHHQGAGGYPRPR
jgi:hypothetical protein